ncbi:CHAT domain-containing protein [Amycolatopsis stemonae]
MRVFRRRSPADPERVDALVRRAFDALSVARMAVTAGAVEEAVTAHRAAIEVLPAHDPDRISLLMNLGGLLRTRFEQTGSVTPLDEAIAAVKEALKGRETEAGDRSRLLGNLGILWATRAEHGDAPRALDRAIEAGRAAVAAATDPVERGEHRFNLGISLGNRFSRDGDVRALEDAFAHEQAATTELPRDHRMYAAVCSDLSVHGKDLLVVTGDLEAGVAAVRAGRAAVSQTVRGHPALVRRLANLAEALKTVFERTGELEPLDELIDTYRAAAAAVPRSDPAHHSYLADARAAARTRTRVFGLPPSQTEDEKPAGPDAASLAADRCGRLLDRYTHGGDRADLDEGIRYGRSALAATSPRHPERPVRLSNLGGSLAELFALTGRSEVIDEAVSLLREAVAGNHPKRAMHLANLSTALLSRYRVLNDIAALEEAVSVARTTVAVTGDGAADRSLGLFALAVALDAWAVRTGELDAFAEAVRTQRAAMATLAAGSPRLGTGLANLGALLVGWASRLGSPDADVVLSEAIETHRAAVAATPQAHPELATRQSNLAGALMARYDRTGELDLLGEAMNRARAAVAATPDGHADRRRWLAKLSDILQSAYERSHDRAQLDEALALARTAIAAGGSPGARMMMTLGNALRLAYLAGDVDVLDEALNVYDNAGVVPGSSFYQRIAAADSLAGLAARVGRTQQAARGYADAVRLLPLLAGRALAREDAEHWLRRTSGLAADAAAWAISAGHPDDAVALLELGRGVLLTQAFDARSDLTELRERDPELAARFTTLTTTLGTDDEDSERRRRAAAELDEVLDRIRELPGLQRFLRPPSLDALCAEAAAGPIVLLNVSDHRSDALILTADGVVVQPLPTCSRAAVAEQARALAAAQRPGADRREANRAVVPILVWLWENVTEPVLRALGLDVPAVGEPPRIWWVPGGLLGLLPLHAAGHHDGSGRAVLDRATSSYTPTARALAHARARVRPRTGRPDPRLLVVAVGRTANADTEALAGARREGEALAAKIPNHRLLADGDATRDRVLAELPAATWVHFACHGRTDAASPSRNELVLYDRALPVRDIMELRIENAELAVLAACDTARTSGELADEAIHLASACQLAGYTHVIGTLWQVYDTVMSDLTATVYETLLTAEGTPAAAVHGATLATRRMAPNLPLVWAGLVHSGN